jgi:hypothetical protein
LAILQRIVAALIKESVLALNVLLVERFGRLLKEKPNNHT